MSTFYYGTLYKKRKNGWDVVEENLDMNCVKNFMCGWEIEADEVYNIHEELKELVHKNEFFYTYKFLGYINKDDSDISKASINQGKHYISEECRNAWNGKEPIPIVFYEDDFRELETIISKIDKNIIITDLNVDKLSSVFVRLKNYYNGNFYDVNSFDEIIKSSKQKLKEIEENKRKWKEISTSLDYLKLSQDEKENVWKSFEYEIEDENNYYTYKLQSAEMLKYTLSLFSDIYNDSNDNVYFYIYSDENCKMQNIPDWLKDKITRW